MFFVQLPKHKEIWFSISRRGAYLFWLGKPAIVRDEEIDTIQKWLIQLRPMMLAYTLQVGMLQLESGPFQVKSNCSSNQYALFASFGVFGMCFKNEDQVVYENSSCFGML
jgi:hypothetical protein